MVKVNSKNKTVITVGFLVLLLCSPLSHAAVPEGELFEKSYEYYLSYQPEKALESFNLFLKEYPLSSARDSALFWKAKTLLQLNMTAEAIRIFEDVRDAFPDSSYRGFAEKELQIVRKSGEVPAEGKKGQQSVKSSALNDRINALISEKEDMQKQLAELQAKHQIIEKGLTKALNDKADLERVLEEKEKRNDPALQAQKLSQAETENMQIEALMKEIKEKEAKFSEAEGARRSLQNEVSLYQNKAKETEARLAQLQKKAEEVEMLQRELKSLEESKKSLDARSEADRRQTEAEVAVLRQERDTIQKKLNEGAGREQEIRELNARIQEQILQQKDAETSIQRLTKEKAGLDDQLKDRDQKIAELGKSLASARNIDTEKEKLLASSQKKASEVEQRVVMELQQANENIQRLRKEKTSLEEELLHQQKKAAELAGKTDKSEVFLKEIQAFENSKKALEAKREADLRQAAEEAGRLRQEKEEIQKRLKDLEDRELEIKALNAGIQELNRALRDSESLINQLREEKGALEKEGREKDRRYAESLKSLVLQDKRIKDLERDIDKGMGDTAGAIGRLEQEKKVLVEELDKERGRSRELLGQADNSEMLLREIDAAKKLNKELHEQFEREKKLLESDLKKMSEENRNVLARNAELDYTISNLQEKMKEWDELSGYVGQLSSEKAGLEKQLQARDRKLAEAESSLAQLQKNSSASAGKTEKSDALVKELQQKDSRLSEAEEMINRLRAEQSVSDARIRESELKIAQLQKKAEEPGKISAGIKELEESKKALEAKSEADRKQAEAEVAMLRQEREAIQKKLNESAGREQETRELNARIQEEMLKQKKAEEAVQKLTQEKAGLEGQLQERNLKLAEAEKTLAALQKNTADTAEGSQKELQQSNEIIKRIAQEKAALEEELRREQKKAAELAGKKDKLEVLQKELKSLEESKKALEAKSEADRKQAEAEVAMLRQEREAIQKKLNESAGREQETRELNARIQEEMLKQKDAETMVQGLMKEKASLEEELRLQQKKSAEFAGKADNTEVLQRELKSLEDSKKALEVRSEGDRKQAEALMKEIKEKETKFAEAEGARKSLQNEVSLYQNIAKETEARLAQLQKKAEELEMFKKNLAISEEFRSIQKKLILENEGLQKQLKAAEEMTRINTESLEKLSAEHEALKKSAKQQASKAAPAGVDEAMGKYTAPIVRIGSDTYSLLSIIDDQIVASRVADKIDRKRSIWRVGNVYDDFVSEQILYAKGRQKGFEPDKSIFGSLTEKLALNERERDYLAKYLIIESVVKERLADSKSSINEAALRQYYDANRDKFLISRDEKTVLMLSLPYTRKDEMEKAVLAVQIQQDAVSGKNFESIRKNYQSALELRKARLSELPDWIQKKVRDLKKGETSSVISDDKRFIILQLSSPEPAYMSFKEVRNQITDTLSKQQGAASLNIADWLREIRKEAVELR